MRGFGAGVLATAAPVGLGLDGAGLARAEEAQVLAERRLQALGAPEETRRRRRRRLSGRTSAVAMGGPGHATPRPAPP